MKAVYLKEMRQYFRSMIGYVFLTVLTFFCGYLFTTGNLMSQNGNIKTFFSSLAGLLMFVVPLLTMRQFSEEQKQKTHQLLFTMPVSLGSIVLGKFLAALSMICIGLSATIFYPVLLACFHSFALLETLGNYIGIILVVSALTAMGIFISTLTENQIISGIVSYGTMILLWLVDSLVPYIDKPVLKRSVSIFSFKSNYIELSYGIFNPAGILYFLSLTILFLILTTVKLDSRRQ